jgi:hypothetical protein
MQRLGHSNEVRPCVKSSNYYLAARNLLKALGPDDHLTSTVSSLETLLKHETPILVTQINHTVSRISDTLDLSVRTNEAIDARTATTIAVVQSQTTIVKKIDKRLSKVQNRQIETAAQVQHIGKRLSVSMSRVEGLSASSRASIEEANEKLDAIISGLQGNIPALTLLTRFRITLGG